MSAPQYRMATLHRFVGKELGVSPWVTVEQARIDRFAQCTGDHQWIHVDAERARRESPYGATIAHGLLVLSLLAPMQIALGVIPSDAQRAIHRGMDRVRFLAPVRSGARVRARVRLISVDARRRIGSVIHFHNTIEIENEERPALVCENFAFLASASGFIDGGAPVS